jgi:hypothetical protein
MEKRVRSGYPSDVSEKCKPSEGTAKFSGYKPFADFFGGKQIDDGN